MEKYKYFYLFYFLFFLWSGLNATVFNPEARWAQVLVLLTVAFPLLFVVSQFVVALFSKKVAVVERTREEYLEEIRKLVHGGPLIVEEVVRDQNSYKIDFMHNGRLYEFRDLLHIFSSGKGGSRVSQWRIVLGTQLSNDLSIGFEPKLGASFISWILERFADLFYSLTCKPISSKDLHDQYPEFRVYANQIDQAKRILLNPDIVSIIRSLVLIREGYPALLPIQIGKGYFEFNFYLYADLQKDPQAILKYLDKMSALADLIDVSKPTGEAKLPDYPPEMLVPKQMPDKKTVLLKNWATGLLTVLTLITVFPFSPIWFFFWISNILGVMADLAPRAWLVLIIFFIPFEVIVIGWVFYNKKQYANVIRTVVYWVLTFALGCTFFGLFHKLVAHLIFKNL